MATALFLCFGNTMVKPRKAEIRLLGVAMGRDESWASAFPRSWALPLLPWQPPSHLLVQGDIRRVVQLSTLLLAAGTSKTMGPELSPGTARVSGWSRPTVFFTLAPAVALHPVLATFGAYGMCTGGDM